MKTNKTTNPLFIVSKKKNTVEQVEGLFPFKYYFGLINDFVVKKFQEVVRILVTLSESLPVSLRADFLVKKWGELMGALQVIRI